MKPKLESQIIITGVATIHGVDSHGMPFECEGIGTLTVPIEVKHELTEKDLNPKPEQKN